MNWSDHFKSLFNSVTNYSCKPFVDSFIKQHSECDFIFINVNDLSTIVKKLDKGKACGLDGLYAEHLMYGGNKLPMLLTMCFNACVSHGHLPIKMIESVLIQ